MKDNRDEMLKKALGSSPVPEELSPENIRVMLEERAPVKKRTNIKATVLKVTAGAAACAVVGGIGLHYAGQKNLFNKENANQFLGEGYYDDESLKGNVPEGQTGIIPEDTTGSAPESKDSIESYEEIYELFGDAYEAYRDEEGKYLFSEGAVENEMIMEDAESAVEGDMSAGTGDGTGGGMGGGSEGDFYKTYNQEEGVLEADIAKTDGEYIYYLYTDYDWDNGITSNYINIAKPDSGSFTETAKLDITSDFPLPEEEYDEYDTSLYEMFLYNDMLVVVGGAGMYNYVEEKTMYGEGGICTYNWNDYKSETYVNVYTTGIAPQLIGSYTQSGWYNDVRINKDGYLYLVTNEDTESYHIISGAEAVEEYIPLSGTCGTEPEDGCIAPEDIVVPGGTIEDTNYLSYTIVGSVDLNTSGSITSGEEIAVAGSTGNVYCSGDNLYIVSGWDESRISRISLNNGAVVHEATGAVSGSINDQFSMSEYNGYFRIATTETLTEETTEMYDGELYSSYTYLGETNHLFVLDMDMNIVGSISDFGIDETIKSVQFNGDMAYVVTYEQTDPLFSIDLSDPMNPVILDEFKILGYSTYMQQWSEGLLLGFGASADEEGVEDGIKLVMFDNSDPNDLREVGIEMITYDPYDGYSWLYSAALSERKMLLIAPEKNLIGVPCTYNFYDEENGGIYTCESRYEFFSYEDGDFISKGSIAKDITDGETSGFERAIYIDDHIYLLSAEDFTAADMETLDITETAIF